MDLVNEIFSTVRDAARTIVTTLSDEELLLDKGERRIKQLEWELSLTRNDLEKVGEALEESNKTISILLSFNKEIENKNGLKELEKVCEEVRQLKIELKATQRDLKIADDKVISLEQENISRVGRIKEMAINELHLKERLSQEQQEKISAQNMAESLLEDRENLIKTDKDLKLVTIQLEETSLKLKDVTEKLNMVTVELYETKEELHQAKMETVRLTHNSIIASAKASKNSQPSRKKGVSSRGSLLLSPVERTVRTLKKSFLFRSGIHQSPVNSHRKCPSSTNSKKNSAPHLLAYDPLFEECRNRQQYFYSRKTADIIIEAIFQHFNYDNERIEEEFVCLCAPSIAEILYKEYKISVTLLDIDTRFNFLPKFLNFDLLSPSITCPHSFSFVLFDPPYFGLPFSSLSNAVSLISAPSCRLLVGFLKRDELLLFNSFPQLRRTTAIVEYDRVKPSRWINYGLYSNCDLKGIRRIQNNEKKEFKPEQKTKKKT